MDGHWCVIVKSDMLIRLYKRMDSLLIRISIKE